MKPFQQPVEAKYGAPMGRHSDVPMELRGPAHLELVPFVDGDYDEGGAYWGVSKKPLYCAWNEETVCYCRASSAAVAATFFVNAIFDKSETVFSEFFQGYVEAMIFTETDEDGESLDQRGFDIASLAPEAREKMEADCRAFIEKAGDDINGREAEAGRDFWYTREGHGVGFWDGDWPEPAASRLTKLAKSFGEVNLYIDGDKVCEM